MHDDGQKVGHESQAHRHKHVSHDWRAETSKQNTRLGAMLMHCWTLETKGSCGVTCWVFCSTGASGASACACAWAITAGHCCLPNLVCLGMRTGKLHDIYAR